jgi:hypothetical protein
LVEEGNVAIEWEKVEYEFVRTNGEKRSAQW